MVFGSKVLIFYWLQTQSDMLIHFTKHGPSLHMGAHTLSKKLSLFVTKV